MWEEIRYDKVTILGGNEKMDALQLKFNKNQILQALMIGFYGAFAWTFSFTRQVTIKNSPEIDLTNDTMVFFRTCYRSMSGNKMLTFLLMLAITALAYSVMQMKQTKQERIVVAFYAILFSSGQMIAKSYKRTDSWELLFGDGLQIFRSFIRWSGYLIVSYLLVSVLLVIVHYALEQKNCVKEEESRSFSWKYFWIVVLLLFLAWLPYFIYFYPGTSNEDTIIQMMEYYKIPSYIQKMSPVKADDIFITNHHPYLLTMLFAQFFELGLRLGDITIGVAIYSLCQMVFLAMVFSGCLQYVYRVGVSKKRTIAVLLLLMFLPIFPLYSVCMVKDTIYSAFCLIFVCMMHHIMKTEGEALKQKGFFFSFLVVQCLMILTKAYAMYILLIIGVVYLFHYRKYVKEVIICFFLPIVLYKLIFCALLLPALNVAPGGIQEALSVPFQQTARYVCEYEKEVTAEEKKAINKVLPYDRLHKLYNPQLSDPVKRCYKQKNKALPKYFKVWFQMFLKHPDVYVESVLNNTYQYYDVNKVSSLEYYKFNDYLQRHDLSENYKKYYVENLEKYEQQRYVVNQLVLILQKIPVLNLFASVGLLPWIIFFVLLYNIKWKKKGMALLALPLLTLAVCLVSPDNGNSRYIMPILYELPFLFVVELIPEKQTD